MARLEGPKRAQRGGFLERGCAPPHQLEGLQERCKLPQCAHLTIWNVF